MMLMKFKSLAISLALAILLCGYVNAGAHPFPSGQMIIVELTVDNFLMDERIEVPLNNDGILGSSTISHPKVIRSCSWFFVISKFNTKKAILNLKVKVSYVDGTEINIERKVLVWRSKPIQYQFEHILKINTYYESERKTASNHSFNRSGISLPVIRKTRRLDAILPARLIRALGRFAFTRPLN